jgi:hypothetical protein
MLAQRWFHPIRRGTAVCFENKPHDTINTPKLSAIGYVRRHILAKVDMEWLMHQGGKQGRGFACLHIVPERISQADHVTSAWRRAFVSPTRTGKIAWVIATVRAIGRVYGAEEF